MRWLELPKYLSPSLPLSHALIFLVSPVLSLSVYLFLSHLLRFQVTGQGSHCRLASQRPWPLSDLQLWPLTSFILSADPAVDQLWLGALFSSKPHQTPSEEACLEPPWPCNSIFDVTGIAMGPDARSKTRSATGLISQTWGAFVVEVVFVRKGNGNSVAIEEQIFPTPFLIHWGRWRWGPFVYLQDSQ